MGEAVDVADLEQYLGGGSGGDAHEVTEAGAGLGDELGELLGGRLVLVKNVAQHGDAPGQQVQAELKNRVVDRSRVEVILSKALTLALTVLTAVTGMRMSSGRS